MGSRFRQPILKHMHSWSGGFERHSVEIVVGIHSSFAHYLQKAACHCNMKRKAYTKAAAFRHCANAAEAGATAGYGMVGSLNGGPNVDSCKAVGSIVSGTWCRLGFRD